MYRYLIPYIAKERVVRVLNGNKEVKVAEGSELPRRMRNENKKIKFSFNFYMLFNRDKVKEVEVISDDGNKIELEGTLDVEQVTMADDEIFKLSGEFGEICLGLTVKN